MKISIIIPVFNVADYLEGCINSCLNQSMAIDEYEIILIDDGSQDRGPEICRQFAVNNPNIIFYQQENAGTGRARNTGLGMANGEYIWFVDADDAIRPNVLFQIYTHAKEKMLDVLSFEGADVVDGLPVKQKHNQLADAEMSGREYLHYDYSICVPFYLFRTGFLKTHQLRFLEGVMHEDEDFTLKALYLCSKIGFLKGVMYYVTIRQGSITRSINAQKAYDLITVSFGLSEFMNNHVVTSYYTVFHNRISMLLNRALFYASFMSKAESDQFLQTFVASKKLFKHLLKSSRIKYRVEGWLIFVSPRHALNIYMIGRNFLPKQMDILTTRKAHNAQETIRSDNEEPTLNPERRYLFITTHNPFNPVGGAQQRTRLLLDALSQSGYVDLVCFTGDPAPCIPRDTNYQLLYFGDLKENTFSRSKHLLNFLRFWSPYALYAKDILAVDVVNTILRQHDYNCIVTRYIEPVFLCGLYHRKDLVIDADDALEELYRSYFYNRRFSAGKRLYYLIRFLLLRYYSGRLYKRALHLFFSNRAFATYPNSSYLPNIPYIDNIGKLSAAPLSNSKTLLFVGTMSYPPNYLGMDIFIRNCWDKVLRMFPDARLSIVGKGTPERLISMWSGIKGIVVKGFVKDLSEEYKNCDVVIVPIYHGAGTNIKILEAMHANRSCVVSDFAVRGLDDHLLNRYNVMIARSYDDFVGGIVELLADRDLNESIRSHAVDTVRREFSLDVLYSHVSEVLEKLHVHEKISS